MPDAVFVGSDVHDLKKVDSTNTYATSLLTSKSRPNEGTIILAHTQEQGRGQFGRSWYAKPGMSLAMSLILYPGFLDPASAFQLNIGVALGVRSGIQRIVPHADVQLKWPNDLYLNGSKVGGILIENGLSGRSIAHSIAGVGINLGPIEAPEELPYASDLLTETGQEIEFYPLAASIAKCIEVNYLKLRAGDPQNSLRHDYLQALYRRGEGSRFRDAEAEFEGVIVGVEQSGELALDVNGSLRRYTFGQLEMIQD